MNNPTPEPEEEDRMTSMQNEINRLRGHLRVGQQLAYRAAEWMLDHGGAGHHLRGALKTWINESPPEPPQDTPPATERPLGDGRTTFPLYGPDCQKEGE